MNAYAREIRDALEHVKSAADCIHDIVAEEERLAHRYAEMRGEEAVEYKDAAMHSWAEAELDSLDWEVWWLEKKLKEAEQ